MQTKSYPANFQTFSYSVPFKNISEVHHDCCFWSNYQAENTPTQFFSKSPLIDRFLTKGQDWKKLSTRSPRKLLVLCHSCSLIFKCQTLCQKNSKTSIANFWQVWIFWHISFSVLSSWRLDWCCNWWLFTNFRWQSNFCPFKGIGSN